MSEKIKVILGGSEGRMGLIIQELARKSEDVDIICGFDPKKEDLKNFSDVINTKRDLTKRANVYVDFTRPDAVLSNIEDASKEGLDSIIGTTGWYSKLDIVKKMAVEYGRRILYGPNFSPGVNVLFYITQKAARLLGKFGYDTAIREVHHTGKVDSPSGTAITLGDILLKEMAKKRLAYERRVKRDDSEVDVIGMRVGKVAGNHEVWFTPKESYSERLVLQHDIFSPEVLGVGALIGIRWISQAQKEKRPSGVYSFYDDVLGLSKE